jgi:hypothetical protein
MPRVELSGSIERLSAIVATLIASAPKDARQESGDDHQQKGAAVAAGLILRHSGLALSRAPE